MIKLGAVLLILLLLIIIFGLLSIYYISVYNNYQDYIIRINEVEGYIDNAIRDKFDALSKSINVIKGNAVDVLPTLNEKYDIFFIDAAKGKYPIFLKEALRLSKKGSIILADNILYKGYVMSDYNKHKQRTAVTHLREYIKETTENPNLETKILEVGDGLAISRII